VKHTTSNPKGAFIAHAGEIPSRTHVGKEIVTLIGKQLVVREEGPVVTCNIVVPVVFCTYQVWNPMLPRKQLCSGAFPALSGAVELVLACV
jgi:hypothetical protein